MILTSECIYIVFLYCLLSGRYRLHFEAETQKELDHRKHDAKTKPLSKVAGVTFAHMHMAISPKKFF